MIAEKILIDYKAQKLIFKKGEWIIKENGTPRNFYQIIQGEIKMININADGKEFVQGIFTNGQSFGEPPLFLDREYPAGAIAMTDVALYCLSKKDLIKLIESNSAVAINFIENLSKRLHYKSVMAVEIAFENPEHRIMKLLTYYVSYLKAEKDSYGYKIHLTRQQIADLTGLRVETVIKSVKKLEKENKIKIIDKKIVIPI